MQILVDQLVDNIEALAAGSPSNIVTLSRGISASQVMESLKRMARLVDQNAGDPNYINMAYINMAYINLAPHYINLAVDAGLRGE